MPCSYFINIFPAFHIMLLSSLQASESQAEKIEGSAAQEE
jgi:hypothetical protein